MNAGATPSIACVVLTKNEERNLARCLASVAWCEERLVVDSGSTDRTRAVAAEAGVRVLVHVQDGAFKITDQRNWALEEGGITAPWALFLDADEEMTPELRAAIEEAVRTPGGPVAYELTPRYLFWGRWLRRTQGFPNWHARLLRRDAVRFHGGVWEEFDVATRPGRIAEPYNHYANSKGLTDWLARHDRYSTWDAARIVEFLETGDAGALGTGRKTRLRVVAARFYPLRPFARFVQMYLGRLGLLEGGPAFVFCSLYFFYEWMTVVKVLELKRLRHGKDL